MDRGNKTDFPCTLTQHSIQKSSRELLRFVITHKPWVLQQQIAAGCHFTHFCCCGPGDRSDPTGEGLGHLPDPHLPTCTLRLKPVACFNCACHYL